MKVLVVFDLREQHRIERNEAIAFVFPVWWWSFPATTIKDASFELLYERATKSAQRFWSERGNSAGASRENPSESA